MPDHKDLSQIDHDADIIAQEIERESDILAETIFLVPPGMERMRSTSQAMQRLNDMTPEQRARYLRDNPDALKVVMENLGSNGNG